MWNTPFANGKSYKDCFPEGPAIRGNYPYWDDKTWKLVDYFKTRDSDTGRPYSSRYVGSLVADCRYEFFYCFC